MRTQLFCHNCNGYFNVDFDETLNGNHIVKCPKCEHEHYRVIKDGVITDDRWGSRNGLTYYATGYNYTTTYSSSYITGYGASSPYITGAWSDMTASTTVGY